MAYLTGFQREEIFEEQYSSGTDRDWICKECLAHVGAGVFHVCPTWENFESEPE